MAPILNPTDPGLYRVQRGQAGVDPVMAAEAGPHGRYVITTGEGLLPSASPQNWRSAFDPSSPGFSLLVLGVLLFLIHSSRASFQVGAKVG